MIFRYTEYVLKMNSNKSRDSERIAAFGFGGSRWALKAKPAVRLAEAWGRKASPCGGFRNENRFAVPPLDVGSGFLIRLKRNRTEFPWRIQFLVCLPALTKAVAFEVHTLGKLVILGKFCVSRQLDNSGKLLSDCRSKPDLTDLYRLSTAHCTRGDCSSIPLRYRCGDTLTAALLRHYTAPQTSEPQSLHRLTTQSRKPKQALTPGTTKKLSDFHRKLFVYQLILP